MKYEEQIAALVNYFKAGETQKQGIGVEIEHFVVDKNTFRTIQYKEDKGIESILYQLQAKGWRGRKEEGDLVQLNSNNAIITLEPGGQLELSINPYEKISELEEIYSKFLAEITPILESNNFYLITLGYQPKSKIDEIIWSSKKRYQIMSNYLSKKGKYAHNMMKGTAALQIALDYENEEDFIKKFKIANTLSPLIGILLDNSPIFEGKVYNKQGLRTEIWANTDVQRTGVIKEVFADNFSYKKYAEHILDREPILLKSNGYYLATASKKCREIFQDRKLAEEDIEHILTMVFPDVRLKKFIEIRMADSVPPQYTLAMAAFWKGIFYTKEILNRTYKLINRFTLDDILEAKKEITSQGLQTNLGDYPILKLAKDLIDFSQEGLPANEKSYLIPLKEIIQNKETLANGIKQKLLLTEENGFKSCILNIY